MALANSKGLRLVFFNSSSHDILLLYKVLHTIPAFSPIKSLFHSIFKYFLVYYSVLPFIQRSTWNPYTAILHFHQIGGFAYPISYRNRSPQEALTSPIISRQRFSFILILVPTAKKSANTGRPLPFTDVACSPLYPSGHKVRSYAGASRQHHLPAASLCIRKLKFLQWSSLLSVR